MKTKLLVILSDIHAGSDVGLAPPLVKTRKGNVIGFGENIHQQWLWENWLDGISRIKTIVGKSPCSLLTNGDMTEGIHHRCEAALVAALIETHTDMAVECMQPLLKICQQRYVTLGTECHTQHAEDIFAEKIGAETGKAKNRWLIDADGCLIDALHHMTTTSRANLEASAMSILMGNARINTMRSGHRVPNVFIRAHRHCGGHYSDGQGLFCVTGGWQFLTRFGFKAVPDSVPRPSFMVLDWRDSKIGELPRVHNITFDTPQDEIVTL